MNKHIKALLDCRAELERQYGYAYAYPLYLGLMIVAALGCDNDPVY